MTYRFLIYPLLLLTGLQLTMLLRHEPRWFWAAIAHRLLILLACALALSTRYSGWLTGIAWELFGLFVLAPRVTMWAATRCLMAGETARAARLWRRTGWLLGNRSHSLFADSLSANITDAPDGLPVPVRGEYQLWQLWRLTAARQWQAAVDCYDHVDTWGTLHTALQARLAIARALAEVGQLDRAVRSLVFVALSPRAVGSLEREFWVARVSVTALAGDAEELERLLAAEAPRRQRGWQRFVALWRGRCAAAHGDQDEAGRQFTRALALTSNRWPRWRDAINGYRQQLATAEPRPASPDYLTVRALLRHAEAQTAQWRALMSWREPGLVTAGLLALLALVYAADAILFWRTPLYVWLGNVPFDGLNGEWYRPVTALFLHAGIVHWVMNAGALWMFGTAIEKSVGRGRMLAIFFVAGTAANVASAWHGGFDVSVGASGGIFGLVAAFGVAVYRLRSAAYASVRSRLLWLLGLMVAADIVIGSLETQIDNFAHVGGLLVGGLLALLLVPKMATTNRSIDVS